MSSHAEHHDPGHEVHISSTKFYLLILSGLIFLTAVTVIVAFFDFGWANDIIALGIASTKASLVVLFFMHVHHSTRLIKLIVVSSLVWLVIMMGLTYIDYGSRHSIKPEPAPVKAEYQDLIDRGYAAKKATASKSHGDDAGHH